MTTDSYHYLRNYYPAPFNRRWISRNESNVDKFYNIKQRIIKDKEIIEETCAKYRGGLDPWLPVKPFDDHRGMYIDEEKKRGYCINSKVKSDYHPNSLIAFEIV